MRTSPIIAVIVSATFGTVWGARGQCNASINDWISIVPQFSISQALLNSTCFPRELKQTLQQLLQQNQKSGNTSNTNQTSQQQLGATVFLPTDEAWRNTFDLRNTSQAGQSRGSSLFTSLNCSTNATIDVQKCYDLFSVSLNNTSLEELGECIQLLPPLHLVQGIYQDLFNASASTLGQNNTMSGQVIFQDDGGDGDDNDGGDDDYGDESDGNMGGMSGQNVTVLYTLLGPQFGLSSNFSQVLIVTKSPDGRSVIQSGVQSANITRQLGASDGVIYLIDRVLLPPLPLNNTLQALGEQELANLVSNETLPQDGFTAFLPISNSTGNMTGSFNVSSYIVPQAIYLNSTAPASANYSALDGASLYLDQANGTLNVNGSYPIVAANIPLANGVLHLFNYTQEPIDNGTISAPVTTNSTYLDRTVYHWRRWIYGARNQQ